MSCKHEHLRTVGNRLFCKDCKEELPIEFLTAGQEEPERPEAEEQEKPAKKPRKAPAKKKGE